MKQAILLTVIASTALFAIGCGSETANTGGGDGGTTLPKEGDACTSVSATKCTAAKDGYLACGATNTYVVTPCAAGKTCDETSGSAICSGGTVDNDASGSTDQDTVGADTTTADTVAGPDTNTKPAKCDSFDQACIQACGTEKCDTEIAACQGDAKCTGLIQCLNGCQQGVAPPDEVTGTTCTSKCLNQAGDEASLGAFGQDLCVSMCIQPKYQLPCSTDACTSDCVADKCETEFGACGKSKSCLGFLICLQKDCDTSDRAGFQACMQACNTSSGGGGLAYSQIIQCGQAAGCL